MGIFSCFNDVYMETHEHTKSFVERIKSMFPRQVITVGPETNPPAALPAVWTGIQDHDNTRIICLNRAGVCNNKMGIPMTHHVKHQLSAIISGYMSEGKIVLHENMRVYTNHRPMVVEGTHISNHTEYGRRLLKYQLDNWRENSNGRLSGKSRGVKDDGVCSLLHTVNCVILSEKGEGDYLWTRASSKGNMFRL